MYDSLKKGDENDIIGAIHDLNANHVDATLEEIFHLKLNGNITNDLKKAEIFLRIKREEYRQAYSLYCIYFESLQNSEYVRLYLLSLCYEENEHEFVAGNYAFTNPICLKHL